MLTTRYRIDAELDFDDDVYAMSGRDIWLDRPVVIALANPDTAFVDPGVGPTAWAASDVAHPNALEVYDAGIDRDAPYVVVPDPARGTLADELTDGAVDANRAATVAAGVVGGLAALHEAGVAHGRLRPTAVAVTDDGTPRIGPSALAPRSNLPTDDRLRAPAAYDAPERTAGAPPGPRSDVWSAGAVLYATLLGEPPVGARTGTSSLRARRPDVSDDLADVIERALHPDAFARFATALEMHEALDGTEVPPGERTPVASFSGRARKIRQIPGQRWRVAACVAATSGALVGFWPATHPASSARRAMTLRPPIPQPHRVVMPPPRIPAVTGPRRLNQAVSTHGATWSPSTALPPRLSAASPPPPVASPPPSPGPTPTTPPTPPTTTPHSGRQSPGPQG